MSDRYDKKTILLAVANYNSFEDTIKFLTQVLSLPLPQGWELEVAIADNSGNWDHSKPLPPEVTVYSPGANLGYLNGCNFAFEQWCNEHGGCPEWTGVTNTDIELEPEFFSKMLTHPIPESVGIIAPDIYLSDGSPQNPNMRTRPSRLRMLRYRLMYSSTLLTSAVTSAQSIKKRLRNWRTANSGTISSRKPELIYAPHGSIFFLNRRFFDRGCTLAFGGFMYGEEIHIAEQCRIAGIEVLWIPDLYVRHNEHASTGAVAKVRRVQWSRESIKLVQQNYFS